MEYVSNKTLHSSPYFVVEMTQLLRNSNWWASSPKWTVDATDTLVIGLFFNLILPSKLLVLNCIVSNEMGNNRVAQIAIVWKKNAVECITITRLFLV
jgi:hypothetical protein